MNTKEKTRKNLTKESHHGLSVKIIERFAGVDKRVAEIIIITINADIYLDAVIVGHEENI